MRQERRTLREPRSVERKRGCFLFGASRLEGHGGMRRAGCKLIERTAQRALLVPARAMFDRMLERRLPTGKQPYEEKDPCETGEHRASVPTSRAPRPSGDRRRPSGRP
jgi:hypothetical protein